MNEGENSTVKDLGLVREIAKSKTERYYELLGHLTVTSGICTNKRWMMKHNSKPGYKIIEITEIDLISR